MSEGKSQTFYQLDEGEWANMTNHEDAVQLAANSNRYGATCTENDWTSTQSQVPTDPIEDSGDNAVSRGQETSSASAGIVAKVALAILCVGLAGYQFFNQENADIVSISTAGLMTKAAEYLFYSAFLWCIFAIVFLRRCSDSKFHSLSSFCIFGSLLFGLLVGIPGRKQQALAAVSSIQEEFARINRGAVDSDGLPVQVERRPLAAPKATGAFGEFQRFLMENMDQGIAQQNKYLSELDAIGWKALLDGKRLREDSNLEQSKAMVEQAKGIVDKYEKKTVTLMHDTMNRIDTLSIPESWKSGLRSGINRAGKRISKQWALERQVMLEIEKIVDLLASSKEWRIVRDQIVFLNAEDHERFYYSIEEIQRIAQQQEQMRKDTSATFNKAVEELKSATAR